MPKETMTGRERWLAVVNREKPDRVPMGYRGTAEATEKVLKHLGCDAAEMAKKLHLDFVAHVGPRYVGPEPKPGEDIYGRRFEIVQYGSGSYRECVYHPLAECETIEEIDAAVRWPTIDDYDFSGLPKQAEALKESAIFGGASEPFLVYKHLRGDEQAFLDLAMNPEIAHHILKKMYDLNYETAVRIFETIPGQVAVTGVSEDLGGQEVLMYSPEHIREYFFPHMKRIIDAAHQAGVKAFHHSDGAIRDIIPGLIDVGVDILDPIQWRCRGMERDALKRDFGDDLIFHGGVDNQQTLAFGSTDDVCEEVAYNLEVLGKCGGYILGPCHNIQAVSPPENVVAMYEAGYENGWT